VSAYSRARLAVILLLAGALSSALSWRQKQFALSNACSRMCRPRMTRPTIFAPIVSTILRDRKLNIAICGTVFLQLLLVAFGLPGWPCPFFHSMGLPCPGCGMTRASLFLAHGQWKQALVMHAFAPLFMIALAIITLCAASPRSFITSVADKAESLERHTGITGLLLIGLILYWLARLMFMPGAFVRMIQG
jgi:hypothetical protein